MNKTINFMMFVLGVAVGSVVTWRYVEKKYEQIAQDEIDSVKEVFSRRETEFTENTEARIKADNAKEKPSVIEYAARLREQGYTNYSDMADEKPEEVKEESMSIDKPYVIAPEEFGDLDDYETISLTYYADQILADDNDEIVDDIEDVVGFDSLNSFGEYEDDSVFVRNDRLKCDYEILLDQRKYSSVIRRKPHEVDD
jgi:lipopolysaccharide export system protein LptC